MADIKREHLAAAAALAVAGGLVFAAMRKTGVPQGKVAFTESGTGIDDITQLPVLSPDQHTGGVMWTQHTYPRTCGQEVTTLIHYGHSSSTVPITGPEDLWIIKPPSELVL